MVLVGADAVEMAEGNIAVVAERRGPAGVEEQGTFISKNVIPVMPAIRRNWLSGEP